MLPNKLKVNTNLIYDNIVKALTYRHLVKALNYKQLNPPKYFIYKFNCYGVLGKDLSKANYLRFNIHGKGEICQYIIYDINNKIVKYRYYYYSEEQRKKDAKKNKKRTQYEEMKRKKKWLEKKRASLEELEKINN